MDERRYTALSKIAFGFVFTFLDFKLGILNILPDFVGFWMIYSAIRQLEVDWRDLTLLKPFAVALILWNGIDWVLSWFGMSASQLPLVGTVIGLIGMYFHFQLLTDVAQFAPNDEDGSALRSRLLVIRNILIISNTVMLLGAKAMEIWEDMQFVLIWVFAVVFIAILALIANLFHLRNRLRPEENTEV